MKILCAIDGSSASGKTIQALAEHEWPPGTTIRVLTVAEKVHPSAVELVATGQSPADLQRGFDSQCNVAASASASMLQAAGVSSESETREGNPKSIIVEEAHRWARISLWLATRAALPCHGCCWEVSRNTLLPTHPVPSSWSVITIVNTE